jgi:hypothetical protein
MKVAGGHFSLANFSQKFDQKLTSNPGRAVFTRFSVKIHITNPTRRAVFTRFFVKKSFLFAASLEDLTVLKRHYSTDNSLAGA